jgi:hypothetical protein
MDAWAGLGDNAGAERMMSERIDHHDRIVME